MDESSGIWDVVVIGGGPAGMMAAGRAAELGAKVLLIEKNATLGKKLLITGGGRCNVTNAEPDTKKLLAQFKKGGKFLPSPFSQWDTQSSIKFFNEKGMPTKIEAQQRVFPVSDSARSVWDVLVDYMKSGGVTILSNSPVSDLCIDASGICSITLKKGRVILANNCILAAGGISRPETGSTGDAFAWLKNLGHTVSDTGAALVPIALNDTWTQRAAGTSLPKVKITTYQNDVKQESSIGKILFTHVGLSGPVVLNMSRDIGELLLYGPVSLKLDLLPDMGPEKVNAKLQEVFKTHNNKKIRNSIKELIPPAITPVILELAGIDGETPCNSITRPQRITLGKILKAMHADVEGLLGLDKAVITSGGVALEEIDFKTMRSLKYPSLYIIGDLLDIDRPSGGYSLQICWTTGFVAGSSAASI